MKKLLGSILLAGALLIGSITPVCAETGKGLFVRHLRVPLTVAQIQGMFATPVTLVPAPGTGKVVQVLQASLAMTTTATAFANGGTVSIAYDTGADVTSTVAAGVITAGAGTSHTTVIPVAATALTDKAIVLKNATAAFTGGTGASGLLTIYYVVK